MRLRRTTNAAQTSAPPLIGVDDLKTPPWAQVMETVVGTGIGRTLRATPAALRVLVHLAWQTSPRLTLLAAAVELVAGCATAFGLLATANVLTELLAQGPTPQRVVAALPALVLVMASFAARGLLDAAVGAVQAVLAPRVELRAQNELHAAVIGVELIAFDDPDFVELVRRTSAQGIMSVRRGVGDVGNLLSSAISLAAAIVTAGLLNPVLAPVVLLAAVPNGWANVRAALMSYESFVRMVSRMRRLGVTGGIITSRRQAAEVRAFTTQDTLLGEHRRIGSQLAAEAVAVEHRKTAIRLVGRGLAGVGTALAYGVLGVLLYTGALPLALAGAAAVAMRTASTAVSTTVFAANQLFEHSFYLDMLTSCLTQARRHHRTGALQRLPRDPQVIELQEVSFSYPGKDEPALDRVGLTIKRGQVVALVGENGSGKSTLAKVITGLYLPDQGRVSWDGVDIATVDQRELHSQVGVVLQDPVEWPMTAENNVRIGRLERPDPNGSVLAAAAADSGADAVVAELPHGWDTVLSRDFQNGHDLSGGQWQRISVARGLYRDAPLLVADEPTAAMDARAEHAVFQSLQSFTRAGAAVSDGDCQGARTTVLITHRLANIRHADQIIVLDHGRIAEQGTHGELMARGGGYAELFTLQAQAYLGDAGELSPLG
ncbi:MAG TPA: ABC transporter ATP-binding protein [Pseudonocardiaceae bacterium]|nr:ABC transporter ATP-binding protein [Pseudonocardiaceae bacterium]